MRQIRYPARRKGIGYVKRTSLLEGMILGTAALGSLTVGIRIGISLSTTLTILTNLVILVIVFSKAGVPRSVIPIFAPMLTLAIWSIFHDIRNLFFGVFHFENVTLVVVSTALAILVPGLLYRDREKVASRTVGALNIGTFIYFIAAIYVFLLYQEEPAFAIAGLPVFAFHLAKLTYARNFQSLTLVIMLIAFSILLESKIILLTQLSLIGFEQINNRRGGPIKKILVLAILLIACFALFSSDQFSNFFGGGDQAALIGGIAVNTSGRMYHWKIVFDAALQNPILGAGHSVPAVMFDTPSWSHPHNDYLRIFHKYGIVGLIIWGWFVYVIIQEVSRTGKVLVATCVSNQEFVVNRTAFLSVLGLSLIMLTDNPLAYPYACIPMGYLIGTIPLLRNSHA